MTFENKQLKIIYAIAGVLLLIGGGGVITSYIADEKLTASQPSIELFDIMLIPPILAFGLGITFIHRVCTEKVVEHEKETQ